MTLEEKFIGYKNGMVVYASNNLLAQKGGRRVLEQLDLLRRYPVKTDLNGHTVMVVGDSQEDAIERYLSHPSRHL